MIWRIRTYGARINSLFLKDTENNDFYDQQRNVYLRTRLISLEDKILPLVFLKSEGLKPNNKKQNRIKKLEKVASLLAEPFADPEGSSERLALLENLEDGICNLDVDYTLRRYFFITEYVYKLLDEEYLCEWIKNKKRQEVDRQIKKEKQQNKNKEALDKFIINAELEKQKIDTILSNLKKPEIDIILSNLKSLIQKLNDQRKLIEAIKSSLDKLFLGQKIKDYFSKLLDNDTSKQFANKFYRAMLWLHGQFLEADLLPNLTLENLSVQELTKYLNEKYEKPEFKELQSCLDNFFEKFPNDEQYLKDLSNSSLLKKLVEETQKELPIPVKETQKELSINCTEDIDYYSYIKNKLGKYFHEFEKFDTILYPLDYFAGVPEKQLIETFRISLEDAKLGFSSHEKFKEGNRLDKKLAGDSLRAFGGFLKKSWRANDILWGRLDGFNRIVDALVTKEKIKDFKKFLHDKEIAPVEYLDRLLEEALFPSFDPKRKPKSKEDKQYLRDKKEELKEKIEKLFPSSLDVKSSNENEQISEEALAEFVKSLVSIGHLIILDQEFEETMETSIEEQLGSKQQKQLSNESKAPLNIPFIQTYLLFKWSLESGSYSLTRYFYSQVVYFDLIPIPKFAPINLSFDSAITALVVKEVAKKSLTSMSLEEKGTFFNKHYNIGLETWEYIPKSERKKILIKAICIFEDIFTTWQSTSESREENKISSRPTFWNKLGFTVARWFIKLAIYVLKIVVPILYL